MTFTEERPAFETEFEAYYRTMPNDVSGIEQGIADLNAAHPQWSPFQRKASVYKAIAEHCPVQVFRHFPFYYEVGVGKPRTNLGEGGVGQWMKSLPLGQALADSGRDWWQPYSERGFSLGWLVVDDNHHSLGLDNIFRDGLNGFVARAEERLRAAETDDERDFLNTMIVGLRCQMKLANRFADEAARLAAAELAAEETDMLVRDRLLRMADVAQRIPANPPKTFYEALCAILFARETTQSLEGNGISILAHLDRMVGPFYERDLAAGRIDRDEAKNLLGYFIAQSDTRFGMYDIVADHVGTNTTIMIGGCERDGTPVFNDVTRMIAEIYLEQRFIDSKLNARVSLGHPQEYRDLLSGLVEAGCNSLALFNDDVVIPANVAMGKAVEDCRLYAGGGCQENVLENTEINSRATIYMSLPGVFMGGFFPEDWAVISDRDGISMQPYADCATYDELHAVFLANLRSVLEAHVKQRNLTEAEGVRYNPCPLHSASIDDCIANAQDMMDGGTRYKNGSVSLGGIGTLIDSAFVVRRMVFEENAIPFDQLRDMLRADFDGEEAFRQHLVNHVPKFGHDDPEIRDFSARIFSDVASASRGLRNTRGGEYEASLFSFRTFTHFGKSLGATPDGRRAGEHVSPGMSPTMLSLGPQCGISQVLRSLEPVDMSEYPVVAVLDVKMPASRTGFGDGVVRSVIDCFLEYGGSVVQINVVDPALLIEAREYPERHPDLVVRISGYSAYFRTLSRSLQDEVIERTLVNTG
jgi:trans-4-hydroxy-L-proline dehydratase